jgi:hypothetical protein
MPLRRAKGLLGRRVDVLRETLDQRLSPSHRSIALSLDEVKAFDQCVEWLEDYIAQPDARIGREGAICPFVRPFTSGLHHVPDLPEGHEA